MSENITHDQESVINQENQEKLRTPAQIITDILNVRKEVKSGGRGYQALSNEMLKGAEEMLQNGEEDKAFALMTTGLQLESSVMGRKSADIMFDVNEGMKKTTYKIEEASKSFSSSVNNMGRSADKISDSSSKINSAASRISGR